jgi:hypothetical protein
LLDETEEKHGKSQDGRPPFGDSNPGPPEYQTTMTVCDMEESLADRDEFEDTVTWLIRTRRGGERLC